MKKLTTYLLTLLLLTQCGHAQKYYGSGTHQVSHSEWDNLLKKYVDEEGNVNYKNFDRAALRQYLSHLQENLPSSSWTDAQQIAYWINVYNAYTIELVLDYYPVSSIKDIGGKINIPFISSPWDIKFIPLGKDTVDLNYIEHSILRGEFNEPRIHFALVCASASCPQLRREAFIAGKLDNQLSEQTRQFLSDTSKNIISSSTVQLSKIFQWYGGDFRKNTSLIGYLNQYSPVRINENADISFLPYDWSLNE